MADFRMELQHIQLKWIDTAIMGAFGLFAIVTFLPAVFGIWAPVKASTACDKLKEKLNEVRISDLQQDVNDRLVILERAMENVNNGQGVGFEVPPGIVIDKTMLKVVGAKLFVAASAGLTALLAVHARGHALRSGAQCTLSAAQVGMVQSMLQERDASCVYNMTVDAVLGM